MIQRVKRIIAQEIIDFTQTSFVGHFYNLSQGRGKRFKSKKERNAHLAQLASAAEEEKKAKEAAAAQAEKVSCIEWS